MSLSLDKLTQLYECEAAERSERLLANVEFRGSIRKEDMDIEPINESDLWINNVDHIKIETQYAGDDEPNCALVWDYPATRRKQTDLKLVNPDEQITDEATITIEFPRLPQLGDTTEFEFSNAGGFTRHLLFRCIYKTYKEHYRPPGPLFIEGVMEFANGSFSLVIGT